MQQAQVLRTYGKASKGMEKIFILNKIFAVKIQKYFWTEK